jgi:hypothetical protein
MRGVRLRAFLDESHLRALKVYLISIFKEGLLCFEQCFSLLETIRNYKRKMEVILSNS